MASARPFGAEGTSAVASALNASFVACGLLQSLPRQSEARRRFAATREASRARARRKNQKVKAPNGAGGCWGPSAGSTASPGGAQLSVTF